MILFWIICALMVLLALWFVLPALLRREPDEQPQESRTASLLIYQDQFQELEADLKNGLIGATQYQQEKEELERRLLAEVPAKDKPSPRSGSKLARNVAYGVAMGIPIAVILFYLAIGNPNMLNTGPANRSNAVVR